MEPTLTPWYTLSIADVLEQLRTGREQGLSTDEAGRRLAELGTNTIREVPAKSRLAILVEQFTSLLVVILIVAAIISYFVGDLKDTVVILAIVVLNAILGFVQEYRAEQAVAAL